MIELRRLTKSYEGTVALQPTDLSIRSGETTVLIGPSGCGKSTLLRLIVGLIEPTGGEVHVGGTLVGSDSLLSVRRKTGYVIQEGGLFPHLDARGNIALMARHLGTPEEAVSKRLEALCDLTRFPPEMLSRYPSELSGGQRQRVSLMRALMLEPDVLLLDEPLGALDPMVRADLQSDLRTIFRELNQTVVMVTHDMGEAAYLGDRIVMLSQGEIIQDGSLRELLEEPASAFVTEFISAQRSVVAL